VIYSMPIDISSTGRSQVYNFKTAAVPDQLRMMPGYMGIADLKVVVWGPANGELTHSIILYSKGAIRKATKTKLTI